MLDLASKKCVPCEGGVPPLEASEAHALTARLQEGWSVSKDAKNLHRSYRFEDFYRTMSFVNAVAHIANTEDHHPDLVIGYNYCRITYSTHSIGGLSANDFICAAKIDRL
ncbi:MAG TPA: 4a-hydroxytetrahydrobiopterin dehydratase [Steroidobacteraceae bacterium]|nr:4a-hydroxytetrahydrobiopterin dehydratase [Steroidobacteraceae bacterium]